MTALNDLTVGLRQLLRGQGLTCPSSTAPASDRTVTLTVRRIGSPQDADGETATGSRGGGETPVAVSCLLRSGIDGDTEWLGATMDVIERTIGTIRNQVINGVPVAFMAWDYSADLGLGDRGRPEASVQYRARCALPVLA